MKTPSLIDRRSIVVDKVDPVTHAAERQKGREIDRRQDLANRSVAPAELDDPVGMQTTERPPAVVPVLDLDIGVQAKARVVETAGPAAVAPTVRDTAGAVPVDPPAGILAEQEGIAGAVARVCDLVVAQVGEIALVRQVGGVVWIVGVRTTLSRNAKVIASAQDQSARVGGERVTAPGASRHLNGPVSRWSS